MGRFYTGDINGRLQIALQPTRFIDCFGVEGEDPSELYYYYEEKHLPKIKAVVEEAEKELGANKEKLETFFKDHDMYKDEQLVKFLGLDKGKTKSMLKLYERCLIGTKIIKCIEENGSCDFVVDQ